VIPDEVVAHGEAVEAELERFIERRASCGMRDPEEADPTWQQSAERHAENVRAEMRAEWAARHRHLARLHGDLAREHEQEAAKLLGSEAG